MTLSVLLLTSGRPYAPRFLKEFQELAIALDAEYVIAGDGAMAQRYSENVVLLELNGLPPEYAIAPGVAACHGDWILRFDDDETCSEAMKDWLLTKEWERGEHPVFSFPYAWLWGDENHFITSSPFWTDPHARLMSRDMTAKWGLAAHSGNPFGTGYIVPVAHLHHKFIVRSFEERQETAKRYDTYVPGAGTGEHYGKFTLPELYCGGEAILHEVGNGAVELDSWVGKGERCSLKIGVDSTLTGKSGWAHSGAKQSLELR